MDEHRPTADFVVETPGRGIQLVVEARNTSAPSPEWAARFMRNLFAHAEIPASEYFLLALRNHLYLWHRPRPETEKPDFEVDTAAALQPYLRNLHFPLDALSESSFELLVHAWLSDLVAGAITEPESSGWLKESGLSDSIRNGTIKFQTAA
jgi:hypothetical protein